MATIVLAYKYGSFVADSTLTIGTDISASDAAALVGNGEARWGTAGPLSSSADILPLWTANTVYTAGQEILDPTGTTILVRKTTGTSRSSYDATEQALWSAAGAGNSGSAGTLTPTAVKTANYTAAAGDFVPVDTTSGNVTVTLPTAPADKTQVEVKHVVRGGTNTVTIAAGGTDKFNVAGGSTTASLSLLREAATFQYAASPGLWYALNNDLPLSQLTPAAIGAEPVHLFGTLASRPSATGSKVLYTATDDNGGTTYLDSAAGTWTKTAGPVTPVGLGGPSYNFAPQNFKKWRAALSKVRNDGQAFAKVLVVGDSTSFGTGSGKTPLPVGAWPYRLQQLLNSYYVPASPGVVPTNSGDSRWTVGSGWSGGLVNGVAGFGDVSFQYSGSGGGVVTFTPGFMCDTVDVYYVDNGQGSQTISADSGETATANGSGSTGVKVTTLSFARSAARVITMTPVSGGFFLTGMECYDSTTKSVRVSQSGVPSTKTSDWIDNGQTYRSLPHLKKYAPDLTIIDLGVNDAQTNVSLATWQANMQTLITAAQISGDVIIATVFPSNAGGLANGATGVALEQSYAAAAPALAATNGCGVIDLNARWVDYATANAAGYMSDGLHPSAFGYVDAAQAIFNALKTI